MPVRRIKHSAGSRRRVSMIAVAAIAACLFVAALPARGDERKVVLVTFDGVRWQDVFRGPDPRIVEDKRFVNTDIKDDVITPAYLKAPDPASALMPFLHEVIGRQGVLLGNRDAKECARVANDMWFSYPGYNEILTGKPDPGIVQNDEVWNPNVSFLEFLQKRPDFHGKVAMVGTWTLFPYIVNTQRTDVPVNVGFAGGFPTDVKTAREGLRLLQQHDQRVVYIAFGDTDEFAHAGDYAYYLTALERGDDFLRQVWRLIQADPYYHNQTTLFVTTDHGRGDTPLEAWQDHASRRYFQRNPKEQPQYNETGVTGSDNVWFAAIGPGVDRPASARYHAGTICAESRQVAASILTVLGEDWHDLGRDIGAPFGFVVAPRR
jgi:hypothetical protein